MDVDLCKGKFMRLVENYGMWGNSVLVYEMYDDISHIVDTMKEKKVNGLVLSPSITELSLLTEIDFINEIYITGNKIKDISQLYSLEKIQRMHLLNDDKMRFDLSHFPFLKKAVLIGRNGVDNLFNHSSLEKIILIDFKEKKEHFVERSLLKSLEIKNSNIPSIPNLSAINTLRSIKLSGLSKASETIFLDGLKNIEEVSVSLCKKMAMSIIEDVSKLSSLKKLALSKMGDISSATKISNLVNLERLFITENTKITDGKIRFLLDMKALSYLVIQGFNHYDINVWDLMNLIKNR